MLKRALGKSDYQISVMGYGCGGYWGKSYFDEKKSIYLVHQAIDGGVNFFDTGAHYCGGNAEIRLGKALKGVDTNKLIIGTKVGTFIKGRKIYKDYSQKAIIKSVESSLKNLNLETLPLLQLHDVPMSGFEEILDTLKRLKHQGKIIMIGASCDNQGLEYALTFKELDVVMLTYNLMNKKALKHIQLAYDQGCGILIKSPMAHTLYSRNIFQIRNLSDVWYLLRVLKNSRHQLLKAKEYHFLNTAEGLTPHEIALLYALHDKVSCVVTGTVHPHHMQRNIHACAKTLPVELRVRIDSIAD